MDVSNRVMPVAAAALPANWFTVKAAVMVYVGTVQELMVTCRGV